MAPESQKPVSAALSRKMSPGVERARAAELDRDTLAAFMLEAEPQRISMDEFRQILMSAVLTGASDVTFQTDQQPRAEIHGILYRAMRRPLSPSEVDLILIESYGGANARTEVNGQRVLDYSYELNLPDGARQRFRVNATGIYGRDGSGVEITFRALPSKTPDLTMVQIDDREIAALTPRDGIVVIAGATGSGKSTTMAAVTRYHLEASPRPVKIVDIQAPIEYTFRDVMGGTSGSSSIIGQSEIGKHIRSFADGVHSALRRKPNIINVGEARDFETISASLEASLTGHLVYTTTHAGSVADAIRRLLTTFPGNERESRAYDLVSALRFLMVQHLVPRADRPGRVPVREYLRFTDRVREILLSSPISSWSSIVTREVNGEVEGRTPEDQRVSLTDVAGRFFRDGVISRADALRLGGPSAVMEIR
ncbi:type IV pilus twitching motility protein PilT [Defluviimonas salinarum]|uniref:ATPase, T2SS/T4P/T4SS family n=1 Tax=Defluviimonas salinarum TaxID=2992147 RepID=A0ABT3J4H6_9RHOB|nr:ATPase, T2SS/T4P/T4SS family [Defluviimonas salinarum]MCW3782587.1 ATPase, T2SS/T4P/T4SS family [Defluviimonas salinarum]